MLLTEFEALEQHTLNTLERLTTALELLTTHVKQLQIDLAIAKQDIGRLEQKAGIR